MKRLFVIFALTIVTMSASAQLLYKISGKGLSSPSYIVGTYHLAPASFADSIPGMRKAMADCQQTYGELVMEEMLGADSLAVLQQALMLPEGMTLEKLFTADEMSRLNAYMKEVLGMDLTNPLLSQQMGKMTPVALSTTLSLLNYMKRTGRIATPLFTD